MQYTTYVSFMVKENGPPQLSSDNFRTLMNIVYLEGAINGLKKAKEAHKGTEAYYKYDVTIFREQKRLTDVTGNIAPNDLLQRMLNAV